MTPSIKNYTNADKKYSEAKHAEQPLIPRKLKLFLEKYHPFQLFVSNQKRSAHGFPFGYMQTLNTGQESGKLTECSVP